MGEGGISLVELAGPAALAILDRLFVSPRGIRVAEMTVGQLAYGKLWRAGELLDEVVIECARTGEEGRFVLNCHGGALALKRVMGGLEAEGAKETDWGEALARQERLGLLDLVQKEAAGGVPLAPTFRAVGVLLDQYGGALSAAVARTERLAAAANWPAAAEVLQRLLATARFGRGLSEPARLVIAGRPNVGKSTLGNALLRFDRLIVHAEPGTTRDTIEEILAIRGVPFTLVDTAGIRRARNDIEREGVQRGKEALEEADVALLVFDGSMPLQPEDLEILEGPLPSCVVPVLNKSDLPRAIAADAVSGKTGRDPVAVSALTGAGLDDLEGRILGAIYPVMPGTGEAVVFTERQERLARAALDAIEKREPERAAGFLRDLRGGRPAGGG